MCDVDRVFLEPRIDWARFWIQGQFCDDKRHGNGTLRMAGGRTYHGAAFLDGKMQHMADRMKLDYKKSVDKKGAEIPIPCEVGGRVPPDFAVNVSVETAMDSSAGTAGEAMTDVDADDARMWQVFACESGRKIAVRLHSGHRQEGQDVGAHVEGQALGTWSSSLPVQTEHAPDTKVTACGSEALQAVTWHSVVHLHTVSGACAFADFQIGGGEDEVAPGAYTLVFSSDGLPDEMVAVTVGGKSKGK